MSSDAVGTAGKKHGYVFEVTADPAQTTGLPIMGMRGDPMTDGQNLPRRARRDGRDRLRARLAAAPNLCWHATTKSGPARLPISSMPSVYDSGNSSATSSNKFGGGNTNLLFRDDNWVSMTPCLGGPQTNAPTNGSADAPGELV